MIVRLAREFRAAVHIVHVGAAEAVDEIGRSKADGVRITAETCPHYLAFAAEDIPDGATAFKCAPPLRERGNRERLWAALADGSIQMVVSDHSPSPPAMKHLDTGDFLRAWGGVASLELGLAAVWTGGRPRGATLPDIARWMSEQPARLAGLDARKGRIEPGLDADLVAFDPDTEWVVDASRLEQRHPVTPYAGRRLRGKVERVWRGAV